MNIPFTAQQFYDVFKNYNLSIWPFQIILCLIAVIAVSYSIKKKSSFKKIVPAILSFFWIWMGVVYNFIFFAVINKLAYLFGTVFIIEGILFVKYGIFQNKLTFKFRPDFYGITGAIQILFALIIYPIAGYCLGHVYPSSPTFGLPCPTTIFTFGLLLWTDKKCPVGILLIPLSWSMIGFTAAYLLNVYEDTALLISGLSTVSILLIRKRRLVRNSKSMI